MITKPVIVLGAGGHAKVLVAALRRLKADILGATDIDPARKGSAVLDVLILGDDSALAAHAPDKILLVNGLGSTETTAARRALYETFVKRGYRFAAVIDPLALITGPVEIGNGGQILAGAVLQPGAVIGANVIINTRASIDHDCIVGAHAHIAPGATLSGGVWVGDGAHIGTGASVIQNIRVGVNGIVGAGAAIIADVPDDATVVGVPARVLKSKS